MKNWKKGKILSQTLCSEMAQNLAQNKQTLLFLNRRGYAPASILQILWL